jgi:CubicO group peptidase (beta-lactamase class C family)
VNADIPMDGYCDPHFVAVRDALADNMRKGDEVGACVAVYVDGKPVVDLWAGHRDRARTLSWERDTLVCMMSVTKAIGALCVLMLADRGRIELDAPVARYWPAFGQNDKDCITVREVLAQEAGLPYADGLAEGDVWNEAKLFAALEAQRPEWPVRLTPCYHSFTAGPLYQGIVRHVDGRSLGQFLREEVGEPFDIDYHVGLAAEADRRRAEFIVTPGTPSWDGITRRTQSPLNRAWKGLPADEDANSVSWRFREFASANGHGNARSVARLYCALACGGTIDGKRIIGQATLEDALKVRWDGIEFMTQRHFRFCTGFLYSCPPFPFGGEPRSFGHIGLGGATSFGDPVRRVGFGYAPNRMAPITDQGPYAGPLIAATYRCLD